ncbi:hypothetical protein BG015_005150 [Linnemannia schmuckeri]|uniref:Uncharacterized protein n=1 Tax=Linnemannia schmuckeri TaxID=64567 RepID=A0A9P5S3E1_9FUNG|nr:hypothetical protein BG015_005150 [Linnemannia schmuckeri]
MDGVDCDWCLVCEKHTAEGETYCSEECRLTELMSSSASSSSSSSSAGSACFSSPSDSSLSLATSSSSSLDNYSMPFVRKQRTSIPNVYAQCTSNPNPPASLMFTTGGNTASALSHHLLLQQQQLQLQQQSKQHQNHNELAPPTSGVHYVSTTQTGANASQYPLFHAALSAFRPVSPSGPQQ